MDKFTKLTGIAAPLPMINVDTDKIIPAKWLKTIKRTGLGPALFEAIRYGADGKEDPNFVLNKEPYRHAKILIAGANFGYGSSREHAPWGILDMGIRCVVAPSFADIFYNNCFKNGILCVTLPQADVDVLMKKASSGNTAGAEQDRFHVRRVRYHHDDHVGFFGNLFARFADDAACGNQFRGNRSDIVKKQAMAREPLWAWRPLELALWFIRSKARGRLRKST